MVREGIIVENVAVLESVNMVGIRLVVKNVVSSQICQHGRQKYQCKECGVGLMWSW